MSNFIGIAVGVVEVGVGLLLTIPSFGASLGLTIAGAATLSAMMIAAGAGTLLSGIGTLVSSELSGPQGGVSFASRNPTAPWMVCYGQVINGGTVIYLNEWGTNNKYLDIVIVLAAHGCQSVDNLLFDTQMIQLAQTEPWGSGNGISYDSFTPAQQVVNITSIVRYKNVVTITLSNAIPLIAPNDRFKIQLCGLSDSNAVLRVQSTTATSPGWVNSTAYLVGDVVVYAGVTNAAYICIANNTNEVPTNATYWSPYNVLTAICGGTAGTANDGQVVTLWPDYGSHIHMEVLGTGPSPTWTETFPGMLYGTPDPGGSGDLVAPDAGTNPWQSTAIVGGMTAVFLRLNYDATAFSGGLPQIAFLLHGKNNILDPRTMTSGYSENAALAIADYLADTTWGYSAVMGTEIPYTQLIAAANACDDAMPLALGGTEPRYAISGKFDLSEARGNILQNMLTSCAGRITYTEGQWAIWPAVWYGSSPVAAPGYSAMSGPFRWKPTVSIRDLFNGVKGTYICPANNWQPGDIPGYAQDTTHGYTIGLAWSSGTAYVVGNIVSYASADWICLVNNTGQEPDTSPTYWASTYQDVNVTADGGQRRWYEVQLPFTISPPTAQRICKIELLRRRHQGTGTFRFNLSAYSITTLDVITMTVPYLNWTDKMLEVLAARFIMDPQEHKGVRVTLLGVEIDVQETDSSIYDWSDTEELTPEGYQQSAMPNPFTPAPPTGLTLESDESTLVVTPQGVADSILVTWTAPVDGYVLQGGHVEIQYQEVENYTTGTVAATNGLPGIVGSGTTWTDDMLGGTVVLNGTSYGIAEVVDTTHINLAVNFAGTTASGLLYTILFGSVWIGLPSVNPIVTQVNINGVTDGQQYYVQIRSVSAIGAPSAWVVAGPVTANGQSAPLPYKPYAQSSLFAPHGYQPAIAQVGGNSGTNSIAIGGVQPVNVLSSIITEAPVIDSYAVVTAHAGNTLTPGSYFAQVFPIDSAGMCGPGSNITQFTITAAAQRASFTVAMPAGTVHYQLFIGLNVANLVASNSPFSAGSPTITTINLDTFDAVFGYGPPDTRAVAYHARAKRVIHGGICASIVATPGFTTVGITIPSAASSGEFVGRYLILINTPGLPASQPFAAQEIIASDTGSPVVTLTVPTGFVFPVGGLVMVSLMVTAATLTSVTDSGLVSPWAPSGLGTYDSPPVGAEIGNQIVILNDPTGAVPAGETVSITGNNHITIFTTPFSAIPGNGTTFIIVEKSWRADLVTSIDPNSTSPTGIGSTPLASIPTTDLQGFVALIQILLQDKYGNDSDEEGDGLAMLYILAPTVASTSISAGYATITPVGGVATFDRANGQNQVLVLNATPVTMGAPVFSGGSFNEGDDFTIYLRMSTPGNWPLPTFTHAAGAFCSNAGAVIQYSVDAGTDSPVTFTFRDGYWIPDFPGATSS